jgi:hypothetical protein
MKVCNIFQFYTLSLLWTISLIVIGSKAASMGVEVGYPIQHGGGEELYFTLLREWIEDCNKHHGDHGIFSCEDRELPTRVLDVGTLENPKLALYCAKCENCNKTGKVENCGGCKKGRYITLSHCWGDILPLCTFKANIKTHLKEIKNDCLQKTFQDAVRVTRQLGIQYLWIDSLCIIQDDDEDWRREAKNMGKVFASAYCTIAATSARNSREGFLDRQPEQPVRLEDVYKDLQTSVYVCGGGFSSDIENGLLNKRGWVFQERALSTRTIHFSATETYWECGSVIRSENLTQIAK